MVLNPALPCVLNENEETSILLYGDAVELWLSDTDAISYE